MIGAFCSLSAGYIGMRIAVIANVRTTQAATESINKALRMAFNGGAVTGLLVVGLALLAVSIFYTVVARIVGSHMAINSLVGLRSGLVSSACSRDSAAGSIPRRPTSERTLWARSSRVSKKMIAQPGNDRRQRRRQRGRLRGHGRRCVRTYAVSLIGAILVGATDVAGQPGGCDLPVVLGGISVLGAILACCS